MIKYIQTNDEIMFYLTGLRAGTNPKPPANKPIYLSLSYYYITELDGLNFRFTYYKHRFNADMKFLTSRFQFEYKNGEFLYKNEPVKFWNHTELLKLRCLNIRVPNIERYKTNFLQITNRLNEISDKISSIRDSNNPYEDYDELDSFIKEMIKPVAIRKMLLLFNVKLTKDTKYIELQETLVNIYQIHLKSYYDDLIIPDKIKTVLDSRGWSLITLDDIDELSDIFLEQPTFTKSLFFKKGDMGAQIIFGLDDPTITKFGNLSDKGEDVFNLYLETEFNKKYPLTELNFNDLPF